MTHSEDQFSAFLPSRVGERLRAGREAQGRELDEIATITRIPLRHLKAIETGDHGDLPATPYSVGFVRTYARALGLEAPQLAQDFRAELGQAPVARGEVQTFEPADPKRVPSRLLAAVALLIAILLAGAYAIWRSGTLSGDDPEARARLAAGTDAASQVDQPPAGTEAALAAPAPSPAAPANGPVVVTATDAVWLRIYEGGGGERYVEKVMQPGETFAVPSTARDPQILTGRPQSIRVSVGSTVIPPLGTPERTIADVSLLPRALLERAGAAPATASPPPDGTPVIAP